MLLVLPVELSKEYAAEDQKILPLRLDRADEDVPRGGREGEYGALVDLGVPDGHRRADGDLISTHAPLPVEYEDLVHVSVAP